MTEKEISEIRNKLEKIYDEDQNIRMKWEDGEKKFGPNYLEVKNIIQEAKDIQEKNLDIVEKILSKYGWLGSNIIGAKANLALFLVIQHYDDYLVMKKYSNIIEEAFKKGNIDNKNYAMFNDRLLLSEGKEQLYGTQFIYDEEKKKYVLESASNIEEIKKKKEKSRAFFTRRRNRKY